jgi:hypothetical protein
VADEQLDPSVDPVGLEPEQAPEPKSWNLGDVLLIAVMYFVSLIVGGLIVAVAVRRFGMDPRKVLGERPVLMCLQGAAYVFTFLCARIVVVLKTRRPFLESIEWNFPVAERVPQLLLLSLGMTLAVSVISSFLPQPANPPITKYFETPTLMVVSTIFGLLVAPLAEELFFRGLLYPALRTSLDDENSRRILGMMLILTAVAFGIIALQGLGSSYALFAPILLAFGLLLTPLRYESAPLLDGERQTMIAVVLTSVLFAYIHQAQLANSWGAVVPILIVGLVVTSVRVRLNSVAAGWLLHSGYNGTIFLIMWAGSPLFRKVN